jgi:hypothetical protein
VGAAKRNVLRAMSVLAFLIALGMLMLYCAYSQNGRVNAVTALLIIVSFIVDITYMAVWSKTWLSPGSRFGYAYPIYVFFRVFFVIRFCSFFFSTSVCVCESL